MFFNAYKKYLKSKKKIFYFSVITIILLSIIYYCSSTTSNKSVFLDKIIIQKAKKYYLDPNLVKAVIWRESNFDIDALGEKGEIGLMQIMQKSAVKDWENYYKIRLEKKGVLFNPNLNIEIGCWYLARCRRHWRKYKEPEVLMLAEYNAGYANIKKWIKNTNTEDSKLVNKVKFKSTRRYVESILEQYKKYSKEE